MSSGPSPVELSADCEHCLLEGGDAQAMKTVAIDASTTLRKDNGAWTAIKARWRRLS